MNEWERPSIIRLDGNATEEVGILSGMLAYAFMDVPASEYLVPDDREERYKALAKYFAIWMRHALDNNGAVLAASNFTAAAVWLLHAPGIQTEPLGYEQSLKAATGPYFENFVRFDAALAERQPNHIESYWHLAFMGVHPDGQGQGLGTRLLLDEHHELDRHGYYACLDAGNLLSLKLYERPDIGYVRRDPPIVLPNGARLYPALRRPRSVEVAR